MYFPPLRAMSVAREARNICSHVRAGEIVPTFIASMLGYRVCNGIVCGIGSVMVTEND